jgi:hypothetical protein
MRKRIWVGCLVVAAFFLMGVPPVGAGPWRHKRCPPPASYSRWTYWAAGAKRLSVLCHHRPVYQYPSDFYSYLPPSYILLPYRCPPVGPAQFYGELHAARAAASPGGLVLPAAPAAPQPSGPEPLPPPTRRPDTSPEGP